MSPQDDQANPLTSWASLNRLHASQAETVWRWFIHRYRPFARGVLRRTLAAWGRQAELESALDELWGYLFSSRFVEHADRGRRFRTFLSGTVRNFARDYCRRQRSRGSQLAEEDPPALPELLEDQELRLFAHQVLHLALGEMDHRQPANAQVIRWFYGVGGDNAELDTMTAPLPVAHIAARLHMKPNAVHQALFRGRRVLRERVEAELRETVASGADFGEELASILEVLGRDAPGLTVE